MTFHSICNIATAFRPVALKGDLIAFCDEGSDTVVMDWRRNAFALLRGAERVVDERFKVRFWFWFWFSVRASLGLGLRAKAYLADEVAV